MKHMAFNNLEQYTYNKYSLPIEVVLRISGYHMRYYFTAESIYANIFNGAELPRGKKRQEFINAIEAIAWVHKVRSNMYYIDPEEVHNLDIKPPFVIVSIEEIQTLFNANMHKELLHYLFMIRTFSKDLEVNGHSYIIGYMRSAFFAQIENVNVQTIYRYNKKLESMQLMYFSQSGFDKKNCKTGEVYYCKYKDRMLLEMVHPSHKGADTANFRRSVSYRYTKFLKHPEQFTPEKIAQLREDVVRYNDQCAQLAQAGYTNAQPKDLSVFT